MKSKAPAARFERGCRQWQARLGLMDWCFLFAPEKGDGTLCAQVHMDSDARSARFVYFTATEQDDSPERIAFHEVLHVLYVETIELAARRGGATHFEVIREEHRAIERLCNAIVGPK